MELISEAKTTYLLDATLESLHAESREWLSEISFWSDEMAFFYKLIHLNQGPMSFPAEDVAGLDKQIVAITSETLTKLRNEVEAHERTLHVLLKNTSLGEDADYRHAHRNLLQELASTERLIKNLKQKVYLHAK